MKMQHSDYRIITWDNIFIFIYLYIYIYTPLILLPFNVMHILAMISMLMLCTRYQKRLPEIFGNKALQRFLVLHVFIMAYVLILSILTSGDFSALYYAMSTVFEVIPSAIFISIVMVDRRVNMNKFYDVILGVGLSQVFWVVVTLLVPKLREWVISSSGSAGLEEVYQVVSEYRIYGIARGYTFAMPLFQGLCIILALVLGAYRSAKYYLLVPFFIISVVLNARIGLLALFICPAVLMGFNFLKNPLKQIGTLVIFGVIVSLGILFVQYKAEENSPINSLYGWLNTGVEEVTSLLIENEARGNLEVLGGMWSTPSGADFLFGTGQNIFGVENNSSDIGYVINLYYGGLFFSLLLYSAYFILIKGLYRNGGIVEKNISICLLIYLAIANVKGNVLIPSEIINGVLLLIIYSMISESCKHKSVSRTGAFLASPNA